MPVICVAWRWRWGSPPRWAARTATNPRHARSLDPGLSRVAGTRGDALPAQWWTLYQDPGLNHLVAAALRHNRDLAAADAHARALLGHLRGAQGERWPRTEVGYGYRVWARRRRPRRPAEATDEDLHSQWKHTVRLDLSYQLDLWGEVRARIAAAKADAEAAQAARDLLRVSVASQTTLAYVRACALARRAEVTTPIGRSARREPGAERTPARRRPFQRAAATPALALRERTRAAAADARGAAARGTPRTGAAQRALAAPVGRSCRDLRRHTRNCAVPCPPATAGACWRAARTSARPSAGSPPPTPGARWPKPSCTRASASPSAPKPPQRPSPASAAAARRPTRPARC
ncbi:TolC family protein [Pseudomonas aeruginosa]